MTTIPALIVLAFLGQAAQPTSQVGLLKQADPATRELVLALDSGGEGRIAVPPEASLVRVAPGETDLSKAAKIAFEDLTPGDRLLVRGSRIVAISRADLVRKREAERAEWRNGIAGRIESVDATSGRIAIAIPASPEPRKLNLLLAPNAVQKRYRTGSARFSDAAASTLEDMKAGDQFHALGAMNGDTFTARQIVSGSFRNFAALVESVDVALRMARVRDLERKQTVSLTIGPETALRRLSAETAKALAAGPANARAIVEGLPPLRLEDLNPGEALIIASAEGTREAVPAITILSGAEPLLTRAAGVARSQIGTWNLNLDPTQQ